MGACQDIQGYLDGIGHAVSMPTLVEVLSRHTPEDIKIAAEQLLHDRAINRVRVMTVNERFFDAYYSVRIPTTTMHRAAVAVAEAAADNPVLSPELAARLMTRLEQDVAEPDPVPAAPVIERRAADRRASARLSVMDVLARWCLPYRLARIVEIVAGARRKPLTLEDAAMVRRLVREHVQEDSTNVAV